MAYGEGRTAQQRIYGYERQHLRRRVMASTELLPSFYNYCAPITPASHVNMNKEWNMVRQTVESSGENTELETMLIAARSSRSTTRHTLDGGSLLRM